MADNFNPNVYTKSMFSAFSPTFLTLGQQAANYSTQPNLGIPSMSGVYSGVSPYNLYGYSVPTSPGVQGYSIPQMASAVGYATPDATGMMPTQNWWNNMSQEVKAGAWAPYQQGAQQLIEQLGSQGLAGGARSGYSGALGAALGNYYSDAANKYSTGLWNMSQPGLMADYNARLGSNQYLANVQNQNAISAWNANVGANQYAASVGNQNAANYWQAALGANQQYAGLQNQLAQTLYQNQIQENLGNYQNAMQAWQMPWNTITNYNNLAPSGAYHPEGGGTFSSVMGGLTSILAPVGMGYGMGMSRS